MQWSTDGATWNNSTSYPRYTGSAAGWYAKNTVLPAGAGGQTTLYIAFLFTSAYGNNCDLDGVTVTGTKAVYTYTGFNNMMMAAPSAGSITGPNTGCNGTYSYTSSVAGTPGFTYLWTVTNPSGPCPTCSNSIASPTASSTNITFNNTDPTNPQTFIVNLTVRSECCGTLTAPTPISVVINPTPANPAATAAPASACIGSTSVLTVTGPIAGYNYSWYSAPTFGTLLGSGTSYTTGPLASGANNYYLEAVNSYGCVAAARTLVTVTGTVTSPPTVPNGSTCGAGDVTLSVTGPVAGYTYNWYSGSCGGTLLQSGTGTSYTTYITGTTTYYVSAIPPGCAASTCATPVATYNSPPDPIVWLGIVGGANNWFNTSNWTSTCLPTCASNVSIPDLAIDPDIGFNMAGAAECKDLNLQSGAILSFSDSKAELEICGNFTHTGTLTTNNNGKITFKGTIAQTYTKTGSGNFNNVGINNTAGTPTVTIISGDMVLGTLGNLILQNGKIVTGSNKVIINNTDVGAISGHSTASYVVGNLIRYVGATGSYDFPVGNIDAYELANMNITSGNTASNFTVNFSNPANATGTGLPLIEGGTYDAIVNCGGISPTVGNANGGVWTFTPDVGSANYNMTLYGRNYDNANSSICTILKRTTAGPGSWGFNGTFGSCAYISGVVTCNRTGLSGFSQFAIGRSNTPLPVELLRFNAVPENSNVKLLWTTVTEINNDYFTVEKCKNECAFDNYENWEVVATIDGAGTSNQTIDYTTYDLSPYSGISYYRLKQTDYDGASKYSEPVAVEFNNAEQQSVNIYPNPNDGSFFISLKGYDINENVHIILNNSIGSVVFSSDIITDDNGDYLGMFKPVFHLSKGVYLLEITTQRSLSNEKIIVR